MRLLAFTFLLFFVTPGWAQDWAVAPRADHVPRFEQCLPEQMEAFEARLAAIPGYGDDWSLDATNPHWVQHCGYLAIGICDVSESAFLCQRQLRAVWRAREQELRAVLPLPEEVEGLPLSDLYTRLHALGEGANAGDDCAGETARRYVWCDTFHTVLKLEEAIWAWQVARLMGVMGPLDWEHLSRTVGE